MYAPPPFRLDDRDRLLDIVERHPFGLLVVATAEGPAAAHAPFLVDRAGGALRCHLARANPLAAALDGGGPALVVFQGPAAYISPDWYASPHQVPTWNYVAVHVTGTPRRLADDETARLLADLSRAQEAPLAPKPPWTPDKLPATLYANLRRAIIGIEIAIATLRGTAKLSQNKAATDRQGAAAGLRGRGGAAEIAVADLMAALDRSNA